MKTICTFVLAIFAVVVHAQASGSITMFGGMSVQEGGRARTLGRVFFENERATGAIALNFDTGELVSVRTLRILEIFIPGSTSFVTAEAVASVRQNGQLRLVLGTIWPGLGIGLVAITAWM